MRLEPGAGPAGSVGSRRHVAAVCLCALLVMLVACADPVEGAGARASRASPADAPARRHRITVARSEHGGIVPSRPAPVAHGEDLTLSIFPRTGYHLDSLFVDGIPVRPADVFELRDVRAPHRVSATFAPDEHVILAAAGPHVSVTPSGIVPVPHGRSQAFLFWADSGYKVREVLVDGSPVRA